jgi:hypothetical protein
MADEGEYCGHVALAGPDWQAGGWAFYGRAQNAWPALFRKIQLTHDSEIREVVDRILSAGTSRSLCALGDPDNQALYTEVEPLREACLEQSSMHWVCHPFKWPTEGPKRRRLTNITNSRFWGTIDKIMKNARGSDVDAWSRSILWSNIYKIAPKRWNPSAALQRAQSEFCARLLLAELTHFRPGKAVMLTGCDWFAPFKTLLADRWEWTPVPVAIQFADVIKEIGHVEGLDFKCNVIVTIRPDRRDGSWSHRVAAAVLETSASFE